MAEGLAVLEKHPFFSGSSYAKLVQIAFSMQCTTVSGRKQLIRAGDSVQCGYVISRGCVTVFSPGAAKGPRKGGVFGSLRLAVAQWGHGCMIGEQEVLGRRDAFDCTYETASECELYEIPRASLEVLGSLCCDSHRYN